MVSIRGENQVIVLSAFGKIFLSVINDVVGSKRTRLIQIPGTGHSGDLGVERFGDLHGECADAAGRALNQNLVPGLYLTFIAQTLQGSDSRHGYSG